MKRHIDNVRLEKGRLKFTLVLRDDADTVTFGGREVDIPEPSTEAALQVEYNKLENAIVTDFRDGKDVAPAGPLAWLAAIARQTS